MAKRRAERASQVRFRKGRQGQGMQGVLIAMGGVFLAAMFLVLWIRATVAEARARTLEKELEELRSRLPG
jgi:hypothetical protein